MITIKNLESIGRGLCTEGLASIASASGGIGIEGANLLRHLRYKKISFIQVVQLICLR